MSHVHAELMAQYAEDARETDKPWRRWEVKPYKGAAYKPCVSHPTWASDRWFRQKLDAPEPLQNKSALRDQFAMAAMQGDWAAQDMDDTGVFDPNMADGTLDESAKLYYRMADAMMREREK